MKFTIARSKVLSLLIQAIRTCNTKAEDDEPDKYLLIEERDGGLQVSSVNGLAAQTIQIPVERLEAEPKEAFLVMGNMLVDFVRKFTDEDIAGLYEADDTGQGGTLILGSLEKQTRFIFPCFTSKLFVPLNYMATKKKVVCDGVELSKALAHTAFAASRDETDGVMTGVRVRMEGTALSAEATDDTRISVYTVQVEDVGAEPLDLLVPRFTAEVLSSLLAKEESVTVEQGKSHARLYWRDTVFTASLLDGMADPFPNVKGVLEGEELATIKISKGDLLQHLDLAAMIARDSFVDLELTADGLTISTQEKDRGSRDVVEVQEFTGMSIGTIAPCRNFMEAVKSTHSAWINLSFRRLGDEAAVVVVDGNYQHFLFPIAPNEPLPEGEAEE